jgi:hypothetical protein
VSTEPGLGPVDIEENLILAAGFVFDTHLIVAMIPRASQRLLHLFKTAYKEQAVLLGNRYYDECRLSRPVLDSAQSAGLGSVFHGIEGQLDGVERMKTMKVLDKPFTRSLILSSFVLLAPCGAMANDSSASLQTGGIDLVYNDKIAMKQEDLFLSKNEVRVRYLFENKTAQDVETLVAFPLPDIETGEGGNYVIQAADPINFINFEVAVDGKTVTPSVQARATSLGVDITALLLKHHLPLTTIMANDDAQTKFYDDLGRLPAEALSELERYGAITRADGGPGKPPDVNPQWTTDITFYWLQKFPAGKTIEVTHKYRPVPRVFFTSSEEMATAEMRKRYCPDNSFLNAAEAAQKTGALQGVELRYIVKTARNWSGPIGQFALTIDKEDPKSLLSTCFDGLKKTGPTSFAATKKDYSPDDDLGVVLLDVVKSP